MKNPMEEVNESHMKNYSFTSMLYDDTEPGYVINPENIFNMNKLKSVEIDLTCGNGVMSDSGTNQSFVSPTNKQVFFVYEFKNKTFKNFFFYFLYSSEIFYL